MSYFELCFEFAISYELKGAPVIKELGTYPKELGVITLTTAQHRQIDESITVLDERRRNPCCLQVVKN